MSRFGWVYLSRKSLARAEAQLAGESRGVRDEIGFLLIHQYYADRFFPGTSVLHTRLRYALFVPWAFEQIMHADLRCPEDQILHAIESQTCRQLLAHLPSQRGIIGRRSNGKNIAQPPSTVYWTAMTEWRLLQRDAKERIPSRLKVVRTARAARHNRSHDGELLDDPEPIPFDVPSMPHGFATNKSLSFELTSAEREFMRSKLERLICARTGKFSLLSLLVRSLPQSDGTPTPFLKAENCWDAAVLSIAEHEAECLVRAGQAAALAAIGRGVYAALVESMREEDGSGASHFHRDALDEAVASYRSHALALDIDALALDVNNLSPELLKVLRATQRWLNSESRVLQDLAKPYEDAEYSRKLERARLQRNRNGRRRRDEWNLEKQLEPGDAEVPETAPLHYRWANVRHLMTDLAGLPYDE